MHSTRCLPSRLRSSARAERSKSAYGRNVCMPLPTRFPPSYVLGAVATGTYGVDGDGSGGNGSAGGGALGVVGVVGVHPRHQLAELAAGVLDRVLLAPRAQRLELRGAGVLVVDEPLRERAALDVREDLLHPALDRVVDDPRTGHVVAVLRGVRDRPALLGDAALVHEVDDQ